MRSYRQLNEYADSENRSLHSQDAAGVTSVDVSLSGSYIFAAYDNGQVYMWDSLKANKCCDMPHDSRVSSLGVSPDGFALATGFTTSTNNTTTNTNNNTTNNTTSNHTTTNTNTT